jgi:hypothetical protein
MSSDLGNLNPLWIGDPMSKILIALGLVFLALAAVYWLVPAGSLPNFLPGFEAGSARVHVKHSAAAAAIAVVLFAIAWFKGRSPGA